MSATGFSIFRRVLHAALGEIDHAVKVASREIVVAHRFNKLTEDLPSLRLAIHTVPGLAIKLGDGLFL